MISATQACPFCNHPVPVPDVPGRRLTCQHCGETFAPRMRDVQAVGAVSPLPASAPPPPTPEIERFLGRSPDARSRNRRIAFLVLGVMVVMAAASLALALWTQPWRRANDAGLPGQPKNSQAGIEAPAVPQGPLTANQMPLLAYVPDGTNVLLGVHVAEMRGDPVGRALLNKEFRVVGMSVPLDMTSWTGLDADDVDHTLITVTASRDVLRDFKLAILVRTRRPVNEEQIIQRLRANKDATKEIWNFQPEGLKMDLALRFVNRRTLALGLLPHPPGGGSDRSAGGAQPPFAGSARGLAARRARGRGVAGCGPGPASARTCSWPISRAGQGGSLTDPDGTTVRRLAASRYAHPPVRRLLLRRSGWSGDLARLPGGA